MYNIFESHSDVMPFFRRDSIILAFYLQNFSAC